MQSNLAELYIFEKANYSGWVVQASALREYMLCIFTSHQMLTGNLDVGFSNIMMILRQSIAPSLGSVNNCSHKRIAWHSKGK